MPDSLIKENQHKDKYWALVPAAGMGKRMGSKTPKQYLKLHDKEVLAWTLQTLSQLDYLEKIVLVLNADDNYFSDHLAQDFPEVSVVGGGEERQDSVANGLNYIKTLAKDDDWVFIHDAARPCLTRSDIDKLRNALLNNETGGILASCIKDTLKQADVELNVSSTLNRDEHWLAATPQMFRLGIMLDAYSKAAESKQRVTDEASAVEALGVPVKIVEGRSDNIKITSNEDLVYAEFLLKKLGMINV